MTGGAERARSVRTAVVELLIGTRDTTVMRGGAAWIRRRRDGPNQRPCIAIADMDRIRLAASIPVGHPLWPAAGFPMYQAGIGRG